MEKIKLTPSQVIEQNIEASLTKNRMSVLKVIILGIMAGAFIALGAQAANVAMHNISNTGIARTVAGVIFPVGLMMIVFVGGELFTGDCMLSMAVFDKKLSCLNMIKILFLVYISNFLGAALIAFLVSQSGQLDYSSGALGAFTIKVALGKVNIDFLTALVSGILCNILVCAAVLMAASATDIAGKVLAIFFPIFAFVVSGFEHCVANMYYIPAGIFAALNPDYVQKASELYSITEQSIANLNWITFAVNNLLPVTIGNIIGGSICVGALCYTVYKSK